VILTNPPFQDSTTRGKTRHKVWIEFTLAAFDRLLADGGHLVQVTPASIGSPSSPVLKLLRSNWTRKLRFGTEGHFPSVASTFSDYWVTKGGDGATAVIGPDGTLFHTRIDESTIYLPNDICDEALSIHQKVMFSDRPRTR
jgi:hypothetical protein